jgi:hypothetical protein
VRVTRAWCGSLCALLIGANVAAAAAATPDPRPPAAAYRPDPSRLIDVPFLPQTEALCGGAAAAMVMRYWGARHIYPDDFAPLVDRTGAGIPTDVLVADLAQRRWRALPFSGTAAAATAWMRRHIAQARPVIALIEVGPDRYHYVVVVAWTAEDVVVHDPARAPFQTLSHERFARAWASTGRWALVVLPGDDTLSAADEPVAAPPAPSGAAPSPCGPFVAALVASARAGDIDGADTGLRAAASVCPNDAAVWRELAGIRFLQSRWEEAAALAARAAALDPTDGPGWDLLATSEYLGNRPFRALAAWNHIERPLVDVVRIDGAPRTRHPVIAGTMQLTPRQLLTAEQYAHAERRLQALPSLSAARLRFTPVDIGLAEIDAAVVERPLVPRGAVPLAAIAARAALHRELRVEVAAPTGSGELWSVAWRWWEHRPRVAFSVAVPAVARRLPGVTTVSGLWERASYAVGTGDTARAVRQERRRAGLGSADWATSWLHWNAGVALDRWDADSHAAIDGGLDVRSARDRVAIGLHGGLWAPVGAGRRFGTAGLSVAARSTTRAARPRWLLQAGVDAATAAAPFDLWPGAGTGRARVALLRAHPLLDDGIVTGPLFARRLAHGTGEFQRPVLTRAGLAVAVAGFLDVAHAWRRPSGSAPAWHADAGVGVRLDLPGNGGAFRLDVARGLRDRRHVLSAAWVPPWPGR